MQVQSRLISARVFVQLLVFIVLAPFLPLLISGRWDWWEAWVYAWLNILGFIASRALVARRHPDLLYERSRFMRHENAEPWDRILAPLLGLGGASIPIVAGLDRLLGWSPGLFPDWPPGFSLPVKIAALLVILAGFALSSSALIENRFFSGMVRIQTDRGHQVVSSGPYRWMRHPGYAGALLVYLPTPVFLDSIWVYLPAAVLTILLVVRTALEDASLQAQLAGYREYAGSVRYRLLPGVW